MASILHDIGKLTDFFQKKLRKNIDINLDVKNKYPHQIIGWYFIKNYLNHPNVDKIANLVLWHHANSNSCANLNLESTKISKEINSDELKIMKEFCKYYGLEVHQEENEIDFNNEFYCVDNKLRSILVTADICASGEIDIDKSFLKTTLDMSSIDVNFLNSPRTLEQSEIVNLIPQNTTSLIKAPAGFGKTMIGLLWTIKRNNKLIWVCPTNVISESVYNNIISDMKLLNINISVELYLSGERKLSNNKLKDFDSDIVVTNIDNFIKPSVCNSYGTRALMIYDADVIFDEVHEYDNMDCALLSAFNNIMVERHNVLNKTTLLLTATPTCFKFIRVNGKELITLPNDDSHFNPIHQDKYQIIFLDRMPEEIKDNSFVCFSNVVSDVQNSYRQHKKPKLISHGKYLDEDKIKHKNDVLLNYGKGGERKPVGVFSNQMLTTSCDYSVNRMYIKAPSIQLFFQAIGRLNRWGGYGLSKVYIITDKTKSDIKFIGSEIQNRLQVKFINELRQNFENKQTTLSELYSFYNNFIKANINDFKTNSKDKNEISKLMLKNVYPRKKSNKEIGKKVANANKLRRTASSDEIFISVKRNNSNENVVLSCSVDLHVGTTKLFGEDEKTWVNQLKIIKTFENFNKYKVKDITPEIIRKEAIYEDSPYPVFNHLYDSEIGLFKI